MARKVFIVSVVALGLSAHTAHAFKITWTGSADGVDAYNEGNWKLATTLLPPAAGTIDPSNPINLITEIGNTANAVNASAGALTLGANGLLQISGGTLTTTDVIRRDSSPNTNNSANVSMIISSSPQNAGQVTALGLIEIDVALVDRLTLTDGDNPLKFTTVGLAASPTANTQLHLTHESVADVLAEHLSKFSVAGVPAVIGNDPSLPEPGDNLRIYSDGLLGSFITPITSPILLGDTDGDGDVDDSDLGTALANYTGPIGAAGGKTFAVGDNDGDGDVDDSDLGSSFASYTGPIAPVSVPEPASLLTLAISAAALGVRRR